jgi:hypothetical protein
MRNITGSYVLVRDYAPNRPQKYENLIIIPTFTEIFLVKKKEKGLMPL